MQSANGYHSSSSPTHLSSYASPNGYPPSSFNFSTNDLSMGLSHSPSYYPSHPTTAFQASPLLPPHLLLSSPSHSAMSSPYGGGSNAGGGYGFGMHSPLMSPGPQLHRRSPRLNGRLLSDNANEWNRPYGY